MAKQRRQLGLVGLELLPGGPDGGLVGGGVLEFDHPQRQAVDEQNDVGSALVLVLDNGELVNGEPVVVVRILEIEHTSLCATNCTIGGPVLHRDAVHDHMVKGAVAGFQCRPFRVDQSAKGIVQRFGGKI